MDPRGFPTSLPEFQRVFPNDAACAAYLEKLRWPSGFSCPKCAWTGEPYRFAKRSGVLRCRACKANVSLTAGTVMEATHTPLSTWFWAAYLVTTQTPGMSALQLQRQLGIGRYETAFQILHKLRAAMFRPERDQIGGEHVVEIDETLVGGRTRGEGRGVHHKAVVVAAVEVRIRKGAANDNAKGCRKPKTGVYAGRLRLRVVDGRTMANVARFTRENVAPGSVVRTDAFSGYTALAAIGYKPVPAVMAGRGENAEAHLPMIHRIFATGEWTHAA